MERAAAGLDLVVVAALDVFLLARDGEQVALDVDVEVFLLDARDLDADGDLLVVVENIGGRQEALPVRESFIIEERLEETSEISAEHTSQQVRRPSH